MTEPKEGSLLYLLFHYLEIDLLHVNLLVELGRELGGPQELCVHACSHPNKAFDRRGEICDVTTCGWAPSRCCVRVVWEKVTSADSVGFSEWEFYGRVLSTQRLVLAASTVASSC